MTANSAILVAIVPAQIISGLNRKSPLLPMLGRLRVEGGGIDAEHLPEHFRLMPGEIGKRNYHQPAPLLDPGLYGAGSDKTEISSVA